VALTWYIRLTEQVRPRAAAHALRNCQRGDVPSRDTLITDAVVWSTYVAGSATIGKDDPSAGGSRGGLFL
jgi:hypothetical protein